MDLIPQDIQHKAQSLKLFFQQASLNSNLEYLNEEGIEVTVLKALGAKNNDTSVRCVFFNYIVDNKLPDENVSEVSSLLNNFNELFLFLSANQKPHSYLKSLIKSEHEKLAVNGLDYFSNTENAKATIAKQFGEDFPDEIKASVVNYIVERCSSKHLGLLPYNRATYIESVCRLYGLTPTQISEPDIKNLEDYTVNFISKNIISQFVNDKRVKHVPFLPDELIRNLKIEIEKDEYPKVIITQVKEFISLIDKHKELIDNISTIAEKLHSQERESIEIQLIEMLRNFGNVNIAENLTGWDEFCTSVNRVINDINNCRQEEEYLKDLYLDTLSEKNLSSTYIYTAIYFHLVLSSFFKKESEYEWDYVQLIEISIKRAFQNIEQMKVLSSLDYASNENSLVEDIYSKYEEYKKKCIEAAEIWLTYLLAFGEYNDHNYRTVKEFILTHTKYFFSKGSRVIGINDFFNYKYFSSLKDIVTNIDVRENVSKEGKNQQLELWLKRLKDYGYYRDGKISKNFIIKLADNDNLTEFSKLGLISSRLERSSEFIALGLIGEDLRRVIDQNNPFKYEQLECYLSTNYLTDFWNETFNSKDKRLFVQELLESYFDKTLKKWASQQFEYISDETSDKGGRGERDKKRIIKDLTTDKNLLSAFRSFANQEASNRNQSIIEINQLRTRAALKQLTSFGESHRFKIKKILGEGSFGLVFKCFDKVLERDVAIKVMIPLGYENSDAKLKQEALKLTQSRHQNIIDVYDFNVFPTESFLFEKSLEKEEQRFVKTFSCVYGIVMEYVEDSLTLRSFFNSQGEKLTRFEKFNIFKSILVGVGAAHKNDIIHGDLNPDNILILKDGTPKIIDFGSSSYMSTLSPNVGSLPYISTFNLLKVEKKELSVKSKSDDMYALSILLLWLIFPDIEKLVTGESLKETLNLKARLKIYLHLIFSGFLEKHMESYDCSIDNRVSTLKEQLFGANNVFPEFDSLLESLTDLFVDSRQLLNAIHYILASLHEGKTPTPYGVDDLSDGERYIKTIKYLNDKKNDLKIKDVNFTFSWKNIVDSCYFYTFYINEQYHLTNEPIQYDDIGNEISPIRTYSNYHDIEKMVSYFELLLYEVETDSPVIEVKQSIYLNKLPIQSYSELSLYQDLEFSSWIKSIIDVSYEPIALLETFDCSNSSILVEDHNRNVRVVLHSQNQLSECFTNIERYRENEVALQYLEPFTNKVSGLRFDPNIPEAFLSKLKDCLDDKIIQKQNERLTPKTVDFGIKKKSHRSVYTNDYKREIDLELTALSQLIQEAESKHKKEFDFIVKLFDYPLPFWRTLFLKKVENSSDFLKIDTELTQEEVGVYDFVNDTFIEEVSSQYKAKFADFLLKVRVSSSFENSIANKLVSKERSTNDEFMLFKVLLLSDQGKPYVKEFENAIQRILQSLAFVKIQKKIINAKVELKNDPLYALYHKIVTLPVIKLAEH